MRVAVFGLLGVVCALAFILLVQGPSAPQVAFAGVLGEPGDAHPDVRQPDLSMELAFSGDGSRVLSRRESGEIVVWGLTSGAAHRLGRTSGPFAYCPAKDLLISGDETGVAVTSLNDGQSRRLGDSPADYAAMSADCEVLALASAQEARVNLWVFAPKLRVMSVETLKPVRNGLSLSPDGRRLAAATARADARPGRDGDLETFVIPPWGDPAAGPQPQEDRVVGMWRAAFSPDGGMLFAGSQDGGQAGLRAFDAVDGAPLWGYDGFDAYWMRGLALSQDGALLATGDDSGLLRLWRADSGELLYEGGTGLPIQSLAFSPDGSKLAVGLWDATVGIVETAPLLN